MSMTAVQWAFDQHIEQPTLKLLLVTLAWHHNHDTEQCNPGIDRLVMLSGLSRATVFRALTGLLNLGLISYNRTRGSSNSYVLCMGEKSHCASEKSQMGSHSETLKKNLKEKKQGEARKVLIPEDWKPDAELIAWAQASHPMFNEKDLADATDRFRDHWISKAERRADWRASWRNWIRNDAKFAARSRPAHRLDRVRETNAERINAAMARHGVSPAPGRAHLRLIADRDSGN